MQCSIGAQKHTSKVAEKTTLDDPVFNEELEFEGTLHELLSHGLHLKILDKDCLTRGDCLGELQVSLEPLRQHDVHEYSEVLPTQGSLSFSVTWTRMPAHLLETGTLRVHLQHASGLKSADRNGLSDPYAKLSLAGQQHKSKTVKRTLSPTWDETVEFKGVRCELLSEALQLDVFDYDFASKDDVLGHASVDLRALRGARQHDFVAELSGQGRVHLHISWAARGQLHEPTAPFTAPLGPRHAPPAGPSADHAVPAGGLVDHDNHLPQRQQELLAPRGRTPQAQPLSVPLGPRPFGPPPPTVQVPESRGGSPLPSGSKVASHAAVAPAGIVVKGSKSAREVASASSSGKRGGFLSRGTRS